MATRVIQRTPNLGVTVRMQRAALIEAQDCVPDIRGAGWWDAEAGDWTAVAVAGIVDACGAVGPFIWAAQVTGALCDCSVRWQAVYTPADAASSRDPDVLVLGRYVVVSTLRADGDFPPVSASPGVLALTPVVACASTQVELAAIYLTITEQGSSGPAGGASMLLATDGAWTPSYPTTTYRVGCYAGIYTVYLDEPASVAVRLMSPQVYSYVLVVEGVLGGPVIGQANGTDGRNSALELQLASGLYTVIATTFLQMDTGPYHIEVEVV